MGDFADYEAVDAVRLSWNIWPNNKLEATKAVIPFGACYTPLKRLQNLAAVEYDPLRCKTCAAILNPYCRVDFVGKLWICPFCYARNPFPAHYASISEQCQPAELFHHYTTIEYAPPSAPRGPPPTFVFLVDTCVIEEELAAMKGALQQALSLLPDTTQVGLIAYGAHVQVYEIGFSECTRSMVFQGGRDPERAAVFQQLGLTRGRGSGMNERPQRFILPLGECEFQISAIVEELCTDPFMPPPDERRARSAGTALAVASAMAGALTNSSSHIVMLAGGPCTEGPGAVVGRLQSEAMRSHKDLDKDTATYFRKACKYYDGIAKDLITQGTALDIFAAALDQVGLAEMKICVERSGGHMCLAESFQQDEFKKSFIRFFDLDGSTSAKDSAEARGASVGEQNGTSAEDVSLGHSCNAVLECHTSRDLKISGLLGPASSTERRSPCVSDVEVGIGGTCEWKAAAMDTDTTFAFFFEIVNKDSSSAAASATANNPSHGGATAAPGGQFFIQFITRYYKLTGEPRVRVTTVSRRWAETSSASELVPGFDQEAATALMARLVTWKMETEDEFDATRWLDRSLIRLSARFGEYRPDDPTSFQIAPQMSIYPQFMFNLRRSQFVQFFGNSPDETVNYRIVLNRENVFNSLVMIQPTLISYTLYAPPEPALLDVQAIAPDRILVLDSFFSVVVFHGATITQWKNAGYHQMEEHAAFKDLLEAPKQEAMQIVNERFPVPRFVDCNQNGSQARFLLAKLNPSSTYNTSSPVAGNVLFTDDVSLQVFMDHLKKLAVQS